MTQRHFNIHNLFSVSVDNCPERFGRFLEDELGYFVSPPLSQPSLRITFVPSLPVPPDAVRLMKDLYYRDGEIILERDGRRLQYGIRGWLDAPVEVRVEEGFPNWWVFYAIERTMTVSVLQKGYCLLHASAVASQDKAVIVSAFQKGGKTLYALGRCAGGDGFLGDDLIFINAEGDCLCYPRGVNFNRYHGVHYAAAKKVFLRRMNPWVRRSFLSKAFLRRCFAFVTKSSYEAPIFRLPLQMVYDRCRIVDKAKTDKLILMARSEGKSDERSDWPHSKVAAFLQSNITAEVLNKLEPYVDAVVATGDRHTRGAQIKTAALRETQTTILQKFLTRVTVEFDFNGPNKERICYDNSVRKCADLS